VLYLAHLMILFKLFPDGFLIICIFVDRPYYL
jgi:hypothetical protein